jgi:hypothetical protein
MLKLKIERSGAIVPPPTWTTNPRSEVWRDREGGVFAYAESLGGQYWMHLPGLASFRFSNRGDEVTAAVTDSAREESVLDAYQRRVLPMVLQVSGREILHASAVRSAAGVVALCGDSETGKSTIAVGLSRRGHDLWADDLVAFEIAERGCLAVSLPFEIRLRRPAIELFNSDVIEIPTVKDNGGPASATETAPLAAVCVLRRSNHGADVPVAVRRLSSGEALAAVLSHAWCFAILEAERKRRMINHYLELVARIPIFDVCFHSGLENLPAILDAIEQTLEENLETV